MTTNAPTKQATTEQAKPASASPERAALTPLSASVAPVSASAPGTVAAMQSAAGNRAVAGLLSPGAHGLPASVVSALASRGGRGMEGQTRAFMESRFGQGLGHVRLHADEGAARAADSIGAAAFTVGNSIWFGRGRYQPDQTEGLHLLAHELTHTIQQRGRPPATQASLTIGSSFDASETLADRAADAVLADQPLPRLGASFGAIRRTPKVSPVAGKPNERIVVTDDGTKYRVIRTMTLRSDTQRVPDDGTPKFKPGIDKDNIWLEVEWCKDRVSEGNVKVGVNAPGAAVALLKEAGQAVLRGDDIVTVLPKTKLEPFISFAVTRSKKATVTGNVGVTVEPFGDDKVTGGKAGVTVKTPGADFSGNVTVTAPPAGSGSTKPNVTVNVGVTIPLDKPKEVKCPVKFKQVWVPDITYDVFEQVPEREEKQNRPAIKREGVYLYFAYAKADWASKAGEAGTKRNPDHKARLKTLLADGFQVAEIKGFASPEGPEDPSPRFMGNKALSQARAGAAFDFVKASCTKTPALLDMRPEESSCFVTGLKPQGGGELYSPPHGAGEAEAKGKPLATAAVEAFMKEPEAGQLDPEAPHRADVAERVEKRKGSPERQADIVYPLLRRAELSLIKHVTEPVKVKIEGFERRVDPAPREVLTATEDDFEKSAAVKK